MRRFSPLFGWLVLPTLVLAQDHARRDAHEMHRLHQDPQAYIVMVDFKKAETSAGPPMEMRIDRDDLVREMEWNGWLQDTGFIP
jgi:hypothetical protein